MEGRVRAETGRSSRAEEAGAGDVAHAEHVAWQGVEEAGVTEGLRARGRGRSRVGTSEGRVEMRLKHCVLGGGQPERLKVRRQNFGEQELAVSSPR